MNYAIMILWQVIIMFLLLMVGYLMFKTGKISLEGSKSLGNVLIFLSLPCVIINSFLVERTPERMAGFLLSAVLALVSLLLAMGISRLVLGRHAIDNFAGSFSNPGFFGIPLIIAAVSQEAVFYIAFYIAFLNVLQWTYGVSLLKNSDEKGLLVKKEKKNQDLPAAVISILSRLIKAPFMVAMIIGVFFFLTQLPVPSVVSKCVGYIANLNTPVAMFTIGIYLAQTDVKKMFTRSRLYLVSLVRMVLVPLATLAILTLLPNTMVDMKMAILIAAACPVGSNVAVYAQLHNSDYAYAVETVIISTLFSIITIPIIVILASMLWL